MIFVSHDIGVIRHLADRILILSAGRICESGATREVMEHPSHAYTATLISAARALDAAA